jgi:cysteinyl-tRNA synthetase
VDATGPINVYNECPQPEGGWTFAVRLYNTATGAVEELRPHRPNEVGIYFCGVTVYDYCHIGHARSIIVFDTLRRFLEYSGFKVRFIQNFTDVDDKIILRARREGRKSSEVAERFIKQYFEDFDRLNVKHADVFPRATEHIGDMIRIIEGLLASGHAYITSTGVYFDVSKFPRYGQVSRRAISELRAGARVEPDPTKRGPLDFALWKFSEEDPSWDSPWGRGRPGWHIECSAMALKYLGEVDIHGGGEDLIFPHHENEAAQSEAYTGRRFARLWMHVGLVQLAGEKMSKSIGNIVPIHEALKRWDPNTIRIFCLMTHYRKKQEFSEEALQQAENMWRNLEDASWSLISADGGDGGVHDEIVKAAREEFHNFIKALSLDFNTPLALQAALRLARSIRRWTSYGALNRATAAALRDYWDPMLTILGLRLPRVSEEEKREIEALVRERAILRGRGEFSKADEIRLQLKRMGVELTDYGERTVWKKLST